MIESLDEPISRILPSGYRMCRECGKYQHHPMKYCSKHPSKLVEIHMEKDMSWRDFIRITSYSGSGPLWTIYLNLNQDLIPGSEFMKLHPEREKLYDEVQKLYEEYNHSKVSKVRIRDNIAFIYSKEGQLRECFKLEKWSGSSINYK